MLLMALVIAIAMKIVGVLLITALMIIPAAAARRLSRSPEQMAIFASLLGSVAVVLGLIASYLWDTPAGPAIVLSATGLFILTLLKSQEQ
jgi:zinc transport system permease protein